MAALLAMMSEGAFQWEKMSILSKTRSIININPMGLSMGRRTTRISGKCLQGAHIFNDLRSYTFDLKLEVLPRLHSHS